MRLYLKLAAICWGLALPAAAQSTTEFTLPSGNIGCTYVPAGGTEVYSPRDGGPELICSRVEPVYVTVSMTASSAPIRYDNPGEQGCCSLGSVLDYGRSLQMGPFFCSSATTGLSCKGPNGHWLKMRRAGVEVH
ncbi:MAG: hypothetical protein ACOH2M_09620 [Cypionkella sp.]